MLQMVPSLLNHLSKHPMQDILLREVVGNNIPHVAIVRSKDEFMDSCISQFGTTAMYFGTGAAACKTFDVIPKLWRHPTTLSATKWFHLGKSFAIYSLVSSMMLASPLVRNLFTAQRTGSVDFAEIIGAHQKEKRSPGNRWKLEAKLQEYRQKITKILTLGALGSAAILSVTQLMISTKTAFGKIPQFLLSHLGLKRGKFANLGMVPAMAFWMLPTFAGLLKGARDKFEQKEVMLRFGAFITAFFAIPKLTQVLLEKSAPANLIKRFGSRGNVAELGKFASSVLFCSMIPSVINIFLTRKRIHQADSLQAAAFKPTTKTPVKYTLPQYRYPQFSPLIPKPHDFHRPASSTSPTWIYLTTG